MNRELLTEALHELEALEVKSRSRLGANEVITPDMPEWELLNKHTFIVNALDGLRAVLGLEPSSEKLK